ncbi:MAG: flavin reductase family protein [Bacteroidota bacterium]
MEKISIDQIKTWDRFYRGNFINSLSGFKSVSLIGTINAEGIPNLAIFSNIVHLGADPALIGFVNRPIEAAPHTLANIQETKSFTINHIHTTIYQQAHQTSAKYPAGCSEFEKTGLTPYFHPTILSPFVEESKIKYALSLEEIIPIKQNSTFFVIGAIHTVFLAKSIVDEDGFIYIDRANSLTSLGLDGYYKTEKIERLPYAKTNRN